MKWMRFPRERDLNIRKVLEWNPRVKQGVDKLSEVWDVVWEVIRKAEGNGDRDLKGKQSSKKEKGDLPHQSIFNRISNL